MKRLLVLLITLGLFFPAITEARKWSDLTVLTTVATGDILAIIDVSATPDIQKQITWGLLMAAPGAIGETTDDTGRFTYLGINAAAGSTYPFHITMTAAQKTGINIDGTTSDYTGADAGITALLQRDINRGTGAINNYSGWQSYIELKHTDATITGDYFAYGNITRMYNNGAKITITDGTDRQYWETGAHNTVKEEGRYDTDSTGKFSTRFIGTYSWVNADTYTVYDTGGGVPANVFSASGLDVKVEHVPILNGSADGTFNSYGLYIEEVTGDTAGTSYAYGIYIANAVGGADTNYAIYSASTEDSYLAGPLAALTVTTTPTSAPAISFIDSDGADNDVSAKIWHSLTTETGAGEIGDVYFQTMGAQGTAGALETFMWWDGSEQTLFFAPYTARIEIAATSNLSHPTNNPDNEVIGTYHALGFDDDTDNALVTFEVPCDWDGASDMNFMIYYAFADNLDDGETYKIDISYRSRERGEDLDGGNATTGTFTKTIVSGDGDLTVGKLFETGIVLDWDDGDNTLTAGDIVGISIDRDDGNDTDADGELLIVQFEISYTANKLSQY